jgi:hypothetical protein
VPGIFDYINHHDPEHSHASSDRGFGLVGYWRFNMARITSRVRFLLVVGLTVGCASTRTGSGSKVPGANATKFSWTGSGNVSGSMTATFASAVTFTGRFFQITSSLTDELGPQGPIWHQEGPV